jgi:hypothetical protein
MIRPFTILTSAAAIIAVGYLFHSKNQTLLLDRKIERIARDTIRINGDILALHVEWTALNEPERLSELANKHLMLKPTAPTQFVALSDLATRLPPPRAIEPEPEPVKPAEAPREPPLAEAEESLPIPPLPVPPPARPALIAQTSPAPTQAMALAMNQPLARAVEPARPPAQIQTAARPMEDARPATGRLPPQGAIRQEPTPTPGPQTVPPRTQAERPSAPQGTYGGGGSMLGGVGRFGAAPPLPRPMPMHGGTFDGGGG